MIEFSKDAQYYHQQASIAADQGRWADALFYYRDSLALSFDADVSLDYAYYLKSLRQYDMALLVALPLTTYDLDPDQKQEWCDFMAELCHEKLDFAGYIHYMRLSAALEGKDDSIFDKESLRKTFLEQEEVPVGSVSHKAAGIIGFISVINLLNDFPAPLFLT